MPANKPVPRFVPTLTEVVHPGLPILPTEIDAERLAEQVLQLVKPRLEQQLRASLQALIEQHMRTVAPRMQQELDDAIKVAVAQTIAHVTEAKN
ncbi:MAG: hypothetical protein V4858_27440 [Pseudomonadota bacterium]